jgi:hypothetical protein
VAVAKIKEKHTKADFRILIMDNPSLNTIVKAANLSPPRNPNFTA